MFSFKKMFVCAALFLFAVSSFANNNVLFCATVGADAKSAYYGAGKNDNDQVVTTQVVSNDKKDFIQNSCVYVTGDTDLSFVDIYDAHDHKKLCTINYSLDILFFWSTTTAVVASGTDVCSVPAQVGGSTLNVTIKQ